MNSVRDLSFDEALAIAQLIIIEARELEKPLNFCITNKFGHILLQACMDNTRHVTATIAMRKAQQSALTGESTRWFRDQLAAGQITCALYGLDKEYFVPWAGGVPLYTEENILVGAVGISQLSENQDEEIAIRLANSLGYQTKAKYE